MPLAAATFKASLLLLLLPKTDYCKSPPCHYGPDLWLPCCSCLYPRYVNVPTLKLILAVSSGQLWPVGCHICQLYGCNHLDARLFILCSSTHFNFELARLFDLCERPEYKGTLTYLQSTCLKIIEFTGLFMCNKLWRPRAQSLFAKRLHFGRALHYPFRVQQGFQRHIDA